MAEYIDPHGAMNAAQRAQRNALHSSMRGADAAWRAEPKPQTARVGDELTLSDRAEIERLTGAARANSEVDRLSKLASDLQPKSADRSARNLSQEDWDRYFG